MSRAIVTAAESWIGTPYVHQMSVKGAGCDCLGLLRGVWRAVYGAEPEAIPPYTADWDEVERTEVLWRAASRHLVARPIADLSPGDVLLFRMREGSVAKHLGVFAGGEIMPRFIHAFSGHGVVASPLSRPWLRRVVGVFAFPSID